MSLPSTAGSVPKPGYFPDHIETENNSWIFSYNSLGYWSRQDEITRHQELIIQTEAHRLLKRACTNKEQMVNNRLLFNSMLYFVRYFQRRSHKSYNKYVFEAVCIFIASRVLDMHKSIDEILKRHFEIHPSKEWELKDKIEQLEMNFMGELCYDLILQNPVDILSRILTIRSGETDEKILRNLRGIHQETTGLIDRSMTTQVFLLYPPEVCVISFVCCALMRRKLQIAPQMLNSIKAKVTSFTIMEFFESYNKLVCEIVPIRGSPYDPSYDFTQITERRLKFVLNEINEYPEDDTLHFTIPNFRQLEQKNLPLPPLPPHSQPPTTPTSAPHKNVVKAPPIPIPVIQQLPPPIPVSIIQQAPPPIPVPVIQPTLPVFPPVKLTAGIPVPAAVPSTPSSTSSSITAPISKLQSTPQGPPLDTKPPALKVIKKEPPAPVTKTTPLVMQPATVKIPKSDPVKTEKVIKSVPAIPSPTNDKFKDVVKKGKSLKRSGRDLEKDSNSTKSVDVESSNKRIKRPVKSVETPPIPLVKPIIIEDVETPSRPITRRSRNLRRSSIAEVETPVKPPLKPINKAKILDDIYQDMAVLSDLSDVEL